MARLTPPKPAIKLYEDGFAQAGDQLERINTGKALSDLVERIDDPMVIALDGGWGTGKSFFLQAWVGEHLKGDDHHAQTVYFDAFAHDFIGSPLASLMGVIAERLESGNKGPSFGKIAVQKVRNAALPLTRIALALASYGATEAGGALLDALTKQTGQELDKAAADFWRRESGTRVAMKQFRDALIALTAPYDDGGDPKKLVIVVDELDRCRPDYALSLLEIIKHFFDVPHVHFVLGANLRELENSVSARYGAGINAAMYLQKFVTLTMRLPETFDSSFNNSLAISYFSKLVAATRLNEQQNRLVEDHLAAIKPRGSISLRAMERLLIVLQITTIPTEGRYSDDISAQYVVISLAILKALNPALYAQAMQGEVSIPDLQSFFRMDEQIDDGRESFNSELYESWQFYLDPQKFHERFADPKGRAVPSLGQRKRDLQRLAAKHLEIFNLPK